MISNPPFFSPSLIPLRYFDQNAIAKHLPLTHLHTHAELGCRQARCVWAITRQIDRVCYAWMAVLWWRQQNWYQTDLQSAFRRPHHGGAITRVIPAGQCFLNCCLGWGSKWRASLFPKNRVCAFINQDHLHSFALLFICPFTACDVWMFHWLDLK